MLVVINKADRLPDAELAEGRRFVEAVLAKELQRPTERLYEVSAAERLASSAATRDWIALERELARLASESGASLLREAERRGTRRLCAALVHQLRERRRALEEPLGTSLARLEALRRAAAEAEMALRGVGHAFSAEQEDLSRRFEERRLAFVVEATPRGRQRLVAALDAANEHGPKLRAMGFTMTQQIAEALVLEWLVVVEPIAEEMYRGAMQRLVDGANKLTTRLALGEGASSILELPAETGFHAKRRFHFLAYMTLTSKGPVVWLLDRLRGRDSLQRAVARDMRAFLDRLLEVNSARVANDLRERVLESRRALEAAVRTRLRSLVTISERSIAVAAKAQAQGEEGVHRELALITAMEERVSSVVGG